MKEHKFLYKLFSAFFLLTILFSVTVPSTAEAKKTIGNAQEFLGKTVAPTGISKTDLNTSVGNLIKGALQLVGVAFLVLMVYGGFTWMTARGEEAQIDKAKETIAAAIIGLVVIVGAYAITNFVTQRLILKQGSTGSTPGDFQDDPNAPIGCCEFKVNEIPTWTDFMMTQKQCQASCVANTEIKCSSNDWRWDDTISAAECEAKRQNALHP